MLLLRRVDVLFFLQLLQSPSFKFSRKASSSYSLKLDGKKQKSNKRKPLSTPSSPSGGREPQCTCMTAEQYARLRAQDPRFRGEASLHSATDSGSAPRGEGGTRAREPCFGVDSEMAGQQVLGIRRWHTWVTDSTFTGELGELTPITGGVNMQSAIDSKFCFFCNFLAKFYNFIFL